MARRPTLTQVAEAAGVSLGTASNAFNRPDAVSAATRERVHQAAEQLGYAGPDPAARRLRTGRSGAIGLIFTADLPFAFSDQATIEFLHGVARAVEEVGASVLIVPGTFKSDDPARVVREAAVDGFLLYSSPIGDPRADAALARKLPTVTVDQPRDNGTTFVGIDDRAAAAAAARYVTELGHDRVGVITFADTAYDRPELHYELTTERRKGYADGLGDAYDEDLVVVAAPNYTEQGRKAATELLAKKDPPTAILAMSDAIAAGAVEAARQARRDISIVGFDDSALARQLDLTSVAQSQDRKGEEAARLLIKGIAGEETLSADRRVLLPYEVVARGSTARRPAS